MDREQFRRITEAVARDSYGDRTRIGNLVLRNAGNQLREPQLRHLFALECDRQGQYYAFEAPTHSKYNFSGKPRHFTRARHDLVLFDVAVNDSGEFLTKVLVELKHGHAATEWTNDLVKLLKETAQGNVTGAAIVTVEEHVTQKALFDVFAGLPQVAVNALANPTAIDEGERVAIRESNGWFEFMTIVRYGPQSGLWRAGDLKVTDLVSGDAGFEPRRVPE